MDKRYEGIAENHEFYADKLAEFNAILTPGQRTKLA